MNASDIVNTRLHNHQLAGTDLKTPREIALWLGAIQAQDYNMGKWAIGARVPEVTDRMVEDALNSGEIIRTHILRPTWHIVAAEDIYWMMQLSTPRVKSLMRSGDKELELSTDVLGKAYTIILKSLLKEPDLSRQDIGERLHKQGVDCSDNRRLNHIMMNAELDGIVCNGTVRGKKQTYAILEEKVPTKITLPKDEALERLARKYFTSHSPATLADFVWWSGLSISEARLGMGLIKEDFSQHEIDSQIYWFNNSAPTTIPNSQSIHFLPAFDEYFVSYKNRQHIVLPEHYPRIATKNGIFRPMILQGGLIIGRWKRVVKKEGIIAELDFFDDRHKKSSALIEKVSIAYEYFNR